jgi:hypothetical protein
MTQEKKEQLGADAAAVDTARSAETAAAAPHDEALAVCQNCGCAQAMCLYYKIHGYIACCPECQHTLLPDRA